MEKNQLEELVFSLIEHPDETEWIEFKHNNCEPVRVGEDISALANSAAYHGREYAYKIWGVDDGSHELVGTTFDYLAAKARGNQGLLAWLSRQLSQNANYEFLPFEYDGKRIVVLKIRAASEQPVCFEGATYIRQGSSTMRLVAGSAREAELWRRLGSSQFESQSALDGLTLVEVSDLLNVRAYFDLLGLRYPASMEASVVPLLEQEIVKQQDSGRYAITNVGALLLGESLRAFPGLRKRALRVIRFAGKGSFDIVEDKTFDVGYAMALPQAENYLMSFLSVGEVFEGAFRRIRYAYPQRAVRELLANSVIHQDMTVTNSGPLVRLYSNRIEFSNPGASLIPVDRVLNAQPKTRNNELVGLLRQMDLCEEGGTGWDYAVAACESSHMLAPKMVSSEELGTTVTLYEGNAYERMTKEERLDALYWHACLMYSQGESMNNQSLRERFGLSDERKNTLAVSRLIREACERGIVKEEDEGAGTRYRHYIPQWA